MKKKFFIITFLALAVYSKSALSQKEVNIWYFGNYCGMDFNSGNPVVLSNSAMSAFEGTSTMSDENGNLLFYTNGVTVYNKLHQEMVNGEWLHGHSSTTQCLIVKQPGTAGIYYIFTQDAQAGDYGFQYSIVDMSLQNGLGEVTEKNVPVYAPSTEKICAINKSASEIWIMTHKWNSNKFAASILDANGLNTTPVISEVGSVMNGSNSNTIGYMKFSPDGKRLAYAADYDLGTVEVFDFDRNTGVVSNSLILEDLFPGYGPYGIEFSPNSKRLYAANEGLTNPNVSQVYQWNLAAGSAQDIIDSKVSMGQMDNAGALQLAPDGKIYLAQTGTNYVGVINEPDSIGTACEFTQDFLDLGNEVIYGLPGFNQTFFEPIYFDYEGACAGDSTFFTIVDLANVDSVFWNFDDPASGTDSVSEEVDAVHVFSAVGSYEVELIKYINGIADTVYNMVNILSLPVIYLGSDTAICEGEALLLNATIFGSTYVWQDGSVNSTYNVTVAGNYYVEVTTSSGCTASDTISVQQFPKPEFSLGEDTAICAGFTLILDPDNPGPLYLWQDGSVNSTYTVSNDGLYWVNITNPNGCSASDSIYITVNPSPPVPLIIFVNGTLISTTYLGNQWLLNGTAIPAANLNYYVPTQSGTYQVMVIDSFGCYSVSDPFEVILTGTETLTDEEDVVISPNPFHDWFEIKLPASLSSRNVMYEFRNMQGQLLLSGKTSGQSSVMVAPKQTARGIYFLQLFEETSSYYHVMKLVAE